MHTWSMKFIFLNLFLSFILTVAQDSNSKNQYYIFLDAKTQDIKIIENDSLIYTNGLNKPELLKKEQYPENIKNYNYQFSINQKKYFVNDGGGVVLEYSNGSLKRIDKSFLHKNQYCGSSFQYNNEIYLFAGYGLFTHKNILTRYDFKLKEWYLVPYKSKEYPNPAAYFKSILIGENFYVFGGYTPIDNSVYGKINDPNILWKFNLKNDTWEKIGIINSKSSSSISHYNIQNGFIANNKLYYINAEYVKEVDILNNKITYYKSNFDIVDNNHVVYNPKNKTINYIELKSSTKSYYFISLPMDYILKKPIGEEKLYTNPLFNYSNWTYATVFLAFSSLVFWLKIKTKKKKKTLQKNNPSDSEAIISFDHKNERFYFKDSIIENLSPLEHSVLSYLMNNLEKYTLIHSLNDLIEQSINSQSINTILRKREATLNSLKTKLSLILEIDYDDVILEQKNQQDKRIKEIKLNDQYFKILN